MAITIPWTDNPVANRKAIEAAMEAGEREINGELEENGKVKKYRVDRIPAPPSIPKESS